LALNPSGTLEQILSGCSQDNFSFVVGYSPY